MGPIAMPSVATPVLRGHPTNLLFADRADTQADAGAFGYQLTFNPNESVSNEFVMGLQTIERFHRGIHCPKLLLIKLSVVPIHQMVGGELSGYGYERPNLGASPYTRHGASATR